jgi:hypothetical protein
MKMGIRAYEQEMREKKSKLGVGRGEKRRKGEGVAGSRVALCGRVVS